MATPHPPRRLGRFELIDELGRGAMGVVYRARDPGFGGRIVAVKQILAVDGASGQERLARFRREAATAGRIGHPGVVPVHEVGQDEAGRPFIVMDLIEGEPLERAGAGRALPPERAAALVRELASAVAAAHDAGVLHRDIKPANVLIDAAGRPRLTDFGLASDVSAETQLTRTGQIMGTPSFMAPEQASGEGDHGPGVDVWALGAVLYWCLVGEPPFRGEQPFEVIKKVLFEDPMWPRTKNEAVPPALEAIVLKCLEKEVGDRYESAGELAEELGRFVAGEAVLARPPSTLRVLARRARRHRPALLVAAFVLLVVAAGTLTLLRPREQALVTRETGAITPEPSPAWSAWTEQDRQACVAVLIGDLEPGGDVAHAGWLLDHLVLRRAAFGPAPPSKQIATLQAQETGALYDYCQALPRANDTDLVRALTASATLCLWDLSAIREIAIYNKELLAADLIERDPTHLDGRPVLQLAFARILAAAKPRKTDIRATARQNAEAGLEVDEPWARLHAAYVFRRIKDFDEAARLATSLFEHSDPNRWWWSRAAQIRIKSLAMSRNPIEAVWAIAELLDLVEAELPGDARRALDSRLEIETLLGFPKSDLTFPEERAKLGERRSELLPEPG